MKRVVCVIAVLLFGAWTRSAADDPEAGFVSLFNGKDFTGWTEQTSPKGPFLDKPSGWKIDDNAIMFDKTAATSGHLWTTKEFKNFELHVDWKFAGGTTGLFTAPAHIKIWDVNKTTGWAATGSGSLGYGDAMVKPLKKADKPLGQWNHFRILVESPPTPKDTPTKGKANTVKGTISIWLNSELIINKEPRNVRRAPIGLQDHGSQVWFKNLYIKELPD